MASSFLPDKRVYLIIPENYHETFNTKIAALCSAEIISCSKNEVPQAVDYAFDLCMKRGLKPYYINGNRFGKGNEAVPVRAYFDVYKMINDFAVKFSYIFLPVGTGMTYAGLIAGKHSISQNQNTNIIGISISRNKSKAEQDIRNYISAFNGNICDYDDVFVSDKYICGGYGIYDARIANMIKYMLRENGIAMDMTYTAKAFMGMCEYINENEISGKNILFIHTGGTPLFFDSLMKF